MAKLNQVGLIAGPQWEEEPLPSSACYLRRVNFTLAAGDPCMYGTGTEVAQDATVANVTTCLGVAAVGGGAPSVSSDMHGDDRRVVVPVGVLL